MTKYLKLMPDYYCWPLWWAGGEIGNVDPKTLPLRKETLIRLDQWADLYDSQLNMADPLSSNFFSESELAAFEREGVELWLQLREELSPEYEVWYFSQQLHHPVKHPRELL